MNYWFLYHTTTGEIHGAPYLGYADEWTNIPDGCEVIGPFSEAEANDTVRVAYLNPRDYLIQNGSFVYRPDPNPPVPQPTEMDLLKKDNEQFKRQLAQQSADFQGFTDFFFANNPNLV